MKVFLNEENYIELKKNEEGEINLSIRTLTSNKTSYIITAKLSKEIVDKLIANLLLLKTSPNEEE